MCTHMPAELALIPFMVSSMQRSKCTQCRVSVGPLCVVKLPTHTHEGSTCSRHAYCDYSSPWNLVHILVHMCS